MPTTVSVANRSHAPSAARRILLALSLSALAAAPGAQTTVVANSEVRLDGDVAAVRTRETNLGNLVADAFAWHATAGQPAGAPLVAVIPASTLGPQATIAAGPVTAADLHDVLAGVVEVAVVRHISVARLKALLEHAVESPTAERGQFVQVSGLQFGYDPQGRPGERVGMILLDDDTPLWLDGASVYDAGIDIVTSVRIATGGEGFDFGSGAVIDTMSNGQQVLLSYLHELGGVIDAGRYPERFATRIRIMLRGS